MNGTRLLVYYDVGNKNAYVAPMSSIKKNLRDWATKYPIRSVQNNGYKTWGICVPETEFRKCCWYVLNLGKD